MAKFLIEFEGPPGDISTVIEAAMLPDIRAALDKLARGLSEAYANIRLTGDDPTNVDHYTHDLEAGYRRARRLLLAETIAWLENEFHDPSVEILVFGYDPGEDTYGRVKGEGDE